MREGEGDGEIKRMNGSYTFLGGHLDGMGWGTLLAAEKGALAQLEIAETGDGLALVLNDLFD